MNEFIPYGRQFIDETDTAAVCSVLRSDWLTTGPGVTDFEHAFANYTGARHAVAVSSGTAALHCAMYALGITHGDEVIVPAMTFAATANCVVYQNGTPVFSDVHKDALLIDPIEVEKKITTATRAVIAVDYAGQACDYDRLRDLTDRYGLNLVADSCHALGGKYKGRKVGTLTDMTIFSFHPVKHITTGEGGMIVTDDDNLVRRLRRFRNHGMNTDFKQREAEGSWYYEIEEIGFNYRLTDIQCALGISQLAKLPRFLKRRREIAALYDEAFSGMEEVCPLGLQNEVDHAYHLYVVRIANRNGITRDGVFRQLRENGIGVNIHYIPVHLHPCYRKFGWGKGDAPVAEEAYREILSLPIWPAMDDTQVTRCIDSLKKAVRAPEVKDDP